MSQPPYPGQPYDGQPSSGQPYQGQPPYSGQPSSGQPYGQPPSSGQPYGQPPASGQPYGQPQQPYGQPYGQPNPDVPSSVPPQPGYPPTQAYPAGGDYGQPPQQPYGAYGQPPQPGFGPEGFGQQPGFPPPVPPKKKSKALPIILISVAIVVVLCVGGVTALYMIGKNADDKDKVTTSDTLAPTAAPTTRAADPTTEAPEPSTIQIVEPKTLGGRAKLTDQQFASTAEELQESLKSVPGATNSVGALYGSVEKRNIVIVAAAEAPIANPKKELDQTFYGAGVGGLKITNITTAPTGALGGSAKCGSATTSGIDLAICSWADDGSLGMIIWYFKSAAKAKAEFPALRAQIEKKS